MWSYFNCTYKALKKKFYSLKYFLRSSKLKYLKYRGVINVSWLLLGNICHFYVSCIKVYKFLLKSLLV